MDGSDPDRIVVNCFFVPWFVLLRIWSGFGIVQGEWFDN